MELEELDGRLRDSEIMLLEIGAATELEDTVKIPVPVGNSDKVELTQPDAVADAESLELEDSTR